MTRFAIGVDLGGTNLRIAAVDSNGKLLEKTTTSTAVSRGRNLVIDEMCAVIQQTVTKFRSGGGLEQLASATAIKRMAVEAIATGKAPELARAMHEDPEFSSKVVHQMATQGDEPAKEIFRRVGDALGVALADLVNIFNLPMYVVGGGVASAWDAFAPAMMERVRKNSFVYRATAPTENAPGVQGSNVPDEALPARRTTIITRALLGSDAGLVGAARLPMIAGKITSPKAELKRA